MSPDALVIGAGIAGLSAAYHLREELGLSVTVLEQEAFVASHSSGRNAGIWLPADGEATTPPLALKSAALLDELAPGWLTPQPVLYTAAEEALLDAHEVTGRAARTRVERLSPEAVRRAVSGLAPEARRHGLWVDGAGVIDVHAVTDGLARALRRRDVRLELGVAATALVREGGRVVGAVDDRGELRRAGSVVVASGAWAARLGRSAEVELPLVPLRRHLVQLSGPAPAEELTVWDLSEPLYYRPESGGLLASPCDERESEPCLPAADPSALDSLARRFSALVPSLAGRGVRRSWACLRTFAPDRELVVGLDPRVDGLCWVAGLGGRGMNVGAAIGALVVDAVEGRRHALLDAVGPERLVG